jgi:hypothetical protein
MNGSVSIIDKSFRVSHGKSRTIAGVPGIRAGCGIPVCKRAAETAVRKSTGPAAVSGGQQFSVPAFLWKPYFDLDV